MSLWGREPSVEAIGEGDPHSAFSSGIRMGWETGDRPQTRVKG